MKVTGSYGAMRPQFHPSRVLKSELTDQIHVSSSRFVMSTLASGYAASNPSVNMRQGMSVIA